MSDIKQNKFTSFLDSILRSAEGLEQGKKNDSFSTIELDQISNFFMRIASDCKKSNEGSDLLAKQGINSEDTERNLNKLNNQNEKDKIKGNESNATNTKEDNLSSSYRFTNAIEKCEITMYNEFNQNWDSLKKSIKFERWSNSIFELNDPSIRSIQALDVETFAQAMREVLNAKNIGYKIFPPIVSIMVAWRNHYFGDDEFNPNNIISDYITALKYITKKTDKDMREFLESNKPVKEQFELLHKNAKLYLELRYRYYNFARECINEIDNIKQNNKDKRDNDKLRKLREILNFDNDTFNNGSDNQDDKVKTRVLKEIMNFDNDSFNNGDDNQNNTNTNLYKIFKLILGFGQRINMWEEIWKLLQAGFSSLITKDMNNKSSELETLITLLNDPKNEIPSHSENELINQCFICASQNDELRFDDNEFNEESVYTVLYYTIINNIKKIRAIKDNSDLIIDGITKGNRELLDEITNTEYNPFDLPIYHLVLFDFEKFITDIIDICTAEINYVDSRYTKEVSIRLPVIAAHLCLIFYNIGYFDNAYLKVIINDLISLLPLPKYKDVALAYIALSRGENDEEDAIKFLLSLNLDDMELDDLFNVNLYMFNKDNKDKKKKFIDIYNLLNKLYNEKAHEPKTIKLLTMFRYFEQSLECFNECIYKNHDKDNNDSDEDIISNLNSINLPDISILLEVSRILIKHFNDEDKDEDNDKTNKLLNSSIRYTLHALARSDAFDLTGRIKMVKRAEAVYKSINEMQPSQRPQVEYFESILPMIQISKILNAFETGKSDEAMKIAFQSKILPFNRKQLEEASNFLTTPGLKESSAIGAAIEIIVMHLSKTIIQYDADTKNLRTLLDFCKYLTLKEEVLTNIIQIRIRFSLL